MTKKFFYNPLILFIFLSKAQAVTPEDIFVKELDALEIKGIKVRKGTFGATLANIELIDSQKANQEEIMAIAHAMKNLLPAMKNLDFFEHYPLRFWLYAQRQKEPLQGRILFALLLGHHFKTPFTKTDKDYILGIGHKIHPAIYSMALEIFSGKEPTISFSEKKVSIATPEKILANGQDFVVGQCSNCAKTPIRKGSIKAFMTNMELLQSCFGQKNFAQCRATPTKHAKDLFEATYALKFLQVFNVDNYSELEKGIYGQAYRDFGPVIKDFLDQKNKPENFFSNIKIFLQRCIKEISQKVFT